MLVFLNVLIWQPDPFSFSRNPVNMYMQRNNNSLVYRFDVVFVGISLKMPIKSSFKISCFTIYNHHHNVPGSRVHRIETQKKNKNCYNSKSQSQMRYICFVCCSVFSIFSPQLWVFHSTNYYYRYYWMACTMNNEISWTTDWRSVYDACIATWNLVTFMERRTEKRTRIITKRMKPTTMNLLDLVFDDI